MSSMSATLVVAALAVLMCSISAMPMKQMDPEESLDTIGIIFHWGYIAERHPVVTTDGYILEMHRIPYGKSGPGPAGVKRPVVFLQHGLECSSSNWITNLPWESLGFMMADAGFDVWMGNFRGNTYSKAHINLNPKQDAFWAFSYDHMAKYDLPAMIDYVLATTNASQVYYAGHSEGTMTFFAKMSLDQSFGSKIKKYFALAPVATVGHIGGLLKYIAPFTDEMQFLLKLIGGYGEFLPSNDLMHDVAQFMCGSWLMNPLCSDVLFLIAGADSHQLNDSRTPVYIAHTPAGTSAQNVVHFGQNTNHKVFQMFDWGKKVNREQYGQDTPPLYDVTKTTVPTYIFRGDLDILADPTDVDLLLPLLPNVVKVFSLTGFNHLDFIWGLNAAHEIYQPIIDIIKADQ